MTSMHCTKSGHEDQWAVEHEVSKKFCHKNLKEVWSNRARRGTSENWDKFDPINTELHQYINNTFH